MTRRVDILFFDAGSGHRSAARAIQKAILRERPAWDVRALDVPEVIRHNRSFHWIVERGTRWLNEEMQREKVFDLRGKVNLGLLFHGLLTDRGIGEIAQFWEGRAPDAVVSVTPMYNPALYAAARRANPRVRCITVPVDFEELKRRYWFTPRTAQTYLNATARLHDQARARGVPDADNHRIAGMPVDPDLYDEPDLDVAAEREKLGLDAKAPTAVVHFGGQGSTILVDIARELSAAGAASNVIFLCGKSAAVAEQLRALRTPYRKAVLGYVEETPIHFQRIADVVVGKPGSLTITEGLVARRPLVLLESTGMKPVQRGNEDWVKAAGVGVVARNAAAVPAAVAEVLANPAYRAAAERHRHRGVFEAARAILDLVEDRAPRAPGRPSPGQAASTSA